MLYIAEIEVPNRSAWGNVFQRTVNIPSKVRNIKSICCFAVLDGKMSKGSDKRMIPDRNRKKVESGPGGITVEWNDFYSIQIGNVSISVNNTKTILAGTPLVAMNMNSSPANGASNLRYDSTFANNKIELSEQVELKGGSTLTIVVEERDTAPNYTKSAYHPLFSNYSSNNYKVKIYIEYDR